MNQNNFHNSVGKPLGVIGLILLWFCVFSIPMLEITTCTQGSEDAWLGSLIFFLPVSAVSIGLALLATGTPTKIKWFSLPLFALLPWAGVIVVKYISGVTFGGGHLCAVLTGELGFNSYPTSWWAKYWGPIQLVFIVSVGWLLFKFWWQRPAANKTLNQTPKSGAG
jgi:hypothetical protein